MLFESYVGSPITRPVLAAGFFVGDTPNLGGGAQEFLTGFSSPANLRAPRWCPELASLLEVVALRQLALPEVAAQRKRYLRLERERLLPSVVIPADEPLVGRRQGRSTFTSQIA